MNQTRVLIVEDEEYLRDIYFEILKDEGFYVETASEGNEGLSKVRQGGWDLILMDVILPNIDGIEIIRRVKTNEPPAKPNKKIVFLTNLDKDKEMGQALSLGNGYIIKSQITPDVLMGKIRTYLSAPTQTQTQTQTSPSLGTESSGTASGAVADSERSLTRRELFPRDRVVRDGVRGGAQSPQPSQTSPQNPLKNPNNS